ITSIATMDACVHRHNGRNGMEPSGDMKITSIATMDACVHRHNGRNSMEPSGDMKILDGTK
ncbi:MAG: hypothetical protein ACI39Q_08375, partial [Wujia sp.]